MPETILKSRKQRDALLATAKAARKEEKAKSKVRRAGMLKRAEAYMTGAFVCGCRLVCVVCARWMWVLRGGGEEGGREGAPSLINTGRGTCLPRPCQTQLS